MTRIRDWKNLLTGYTMSYVDFHHLLAAIALGAEYYLLPYLGNTLKLPYSRLLTAAATFIIMSPILRAVLVNRSRQR